MTVWLNVAVAAFTLTAGALSVLGTLAWRRSEHAKLGLLALGFTWFALAGLVSSWWLFTREGLDTLFTIHVSLAALGLLTIYVATVKR